jgi:hypothetical protein
MIKTVKDLMTALEKFPSDMPICIRKVADQNGGYVDYQLHEPAEFFPGGFVCLSAYETIDQAAVVSGESGKLDMSAPVSQMKITLCSS